jgi:hypothetical protein
MHKYHKQAEERVQSVIEGLQLLMPRDGEDISCYNPAALDLAIRLLIDAKVLMACANEAEGRNAV